MLRSILCISIWINDLSAFSPDSARIAGALGGFAIIWDAATGKELVSLEGHRGNTFTARFDPTGKHVVTASDDGTARIWIADTGEEYARLWGHSHHNVLDASFSPDGQRVLTYGLDRAAKIWDLDGTELVTLPKRKGILNAVWGPDGSHIAIAYMNGEVGLWETVPSSELDAYGDSDTPFEERLRLWRESHN